MYEKEGWQTMIRYLKMKRAEWKVKAMLYGAIAALMEHQKDVLELLQKMYVALKDVPAEELRREFVSRLAELIHSESKEDND